MKQKHKKFSKKSGPVFKLSSEEATLRKMPKYNAHQGGYGAHGDKKYSRTKATRDFKKELDDSR